jgi:hypothetical protein
LHDRVEEVARLLRLVCRIQYGQRYRRRSCLGTSLRTRTLHSYVAAAAL